MYCGNILKNYRAGVYDGAYGMVHLAGTAMDGLGGAAQHGAAEAAEASSSSSSLVELDTPSS